MTRQLVPCAPPNKTQILALPSTLTHGGGEGGGTHALALECLLIDAGRDDQRRDAGEARVAAGAEELDVPRHRVLRHPRLHPRLPQLQARLVHAQARLVVVHAAQHKVHATCRGVAAARRQARLELLKPRQRRHVDRVRLQRHVGVDPGKRLGTCVVGSDGGGGAVSTHGTHRVSPS